MRICYLVQASSNNYINDTLADSFTFTLSVQCLSLRLFSFSKTILKGLIKLFIITSYFINKIYRQGLNKSNQILNQSKRQT